VDGERGEERAEERGGDDGEGGCRGKRGVVILIQYCSIRDFADWTIFNFVYDFVHLNILRTQNNLFIQHGNVLASHCYTVSVSYCNPRSLSIIGFW
jgi:hypothetical protein